MLIKTMFTLSLCTVLKIAKTVAKPFYPILNLPLNFLSISWLLARCYDFIMFFHHCKKISGKRKDGNKNEMLKPDLKVKVVLFLHVNKNAVQFISEGCLGFACFN